MTLVGSFTAVKPAWRNTLSHMSLRGSCHSFVRWAWPPAVHLIECAPKASMSSGPLISTFCVGGCVLFCLLLLRGDLQP